MKKLILLFGLAFFISEMAMAQKELNNWFFGNKGALNFGAGTPTFIGGSSLVSAGGSSSISDKQGNLLFYTNGETVWTRLNAPMPNGSGLTGDAGSTQSVLITYYPGNPNLYYIFTTDKAGGPNGLQYSVVDMSLNGGLGDIVSGQKNIGFNLPTAEKLIAVKHRNGRDLWLIVPMYNSNSFFIYPINCTGLISFPIVHSVGNVLNSRGYLKASPDGKKLVAANFGDDFEIMDFDNSTGNLTNAQVIPSSSPGLSCGPYGVEFSPDSKLLYVTEAFTCKPASTFNVSQYRLDPNIANVISSKVLLDNGNADLAGALLLGPDNKIYIAYNGATYMGVINSPNTYGPGCNLSKAGLLQAPATGSFGLPNVIAGFSRTALGSDTTVCDGTPVTLKLNLTATTYKWSDGSTKDSLVVTKTGKYWVDLVATDVNGTDCSSSDTIDVTFQPSPSVNLGKDTALCQVNFPLLLTPSVPGATFLWQDSSTNASFSAPGQGLYWVQATVNGCSARDSINVTSNAGTPFSLGADSAICSSDSLTLTANVTASAYLWNTGSTAKSIIAKLPGTYWCQVTYAGGCSFRDSIIITAKAGPVVNLGNDTTLCQNQFPYQLRQSIPGATFLWQDGSTANTLTINAAGAYWVQATLNGCSSRDTIVIKANSVIPFSLGVDTVLCTNKPLVLTVNPAFSTYLWNNGSTTRNISVSTSGLYWCEASNGTGCVFRDSINVTFNPQPAINLGKDTVVCQNAFPISIGQSIPGASYLWQDGSSNAIYSVTRAGTYSVQATVNGCSSRDTVLITSSASASFSLGADTTICSTGPYTLKTNVAAGSYLWNTGSTSQSIVVNGPGIYWCEINSGTGCSFRDSIKIAFASPIAFSLGNDTVICQNTPLLLDVSNAGDTYSWQDNSTQPTYSVTKTGVYYVTVTKAGCTKADTIAVTYGAQLLPDLGADKTVCPGEELLLDPKVQGTSYLWQDGSTNRTLKVTSPGTYNVRVTNECGTASDEVVIGTGPCKLMIPNAFTPGKSPNNVFRVLNATELKDFTLTIFNRWGQQVFSTSKNTEGWDGRYNGVDQPAGTYIYTVTYTDNVSGKKIAQKGMVVLVR